MMIEALLITLLMLLGGLFIFLIVLAKKLVGYIGSVLECLDKVEHNLSELNEKIDDLDPINRMGKTPMRVLVKEAHRRQYFISEILKAISDAVAVAIGKTLGGGKGTSKYRTGGS